MLLDLIDRGKLRRALWYCVYMLAVLLIQNMILARLAPFGVKPFFIPAAAVAVGLFEGGVWGGVFGIALGFFADIGFGYEALFHLLFPAVGFFSGVLSRWFVNRRFFAYMLVCVAALLLVSGFQGFGLLFLRGQEAGPIIRTALLQSLWGLPLCAPLYFPVKLISRN